MKNFVRAVRIALRYRFTIIGSFLCALLIAALWGANIGAMYPLVEVSFRSSSMREWIAEEIAASQAVITRQEDALTELRRRQPLAEAAEQRELERQITFEHSRLQAERDALARSLWLQPYIERFTPTKPFHTVLWIVVALLVSTAVKGACIIGHMMLSARLLERVKLDLRGQFFQHTLRSDIQRVHQEGTSRLMTHFSNDIEQISCAVNFLFGPAVREPLKAAACLFGAAMICWRLLVLSLLIAPLAAFLVHRLARSIKRANRRMLEEVTALNQVAFESFNGLSTVQVYTMERWERARFLRVARECSRKALRIVLYNALTKPLTELLGISIIGLALTAGAYLVLNQETHLLGIKISERPISMPAMLVFFGLLVGVSDPARKMSDLLNIIQAGVASADRFFPLLDQQPRITDPAGAAPIRARHRRLTFEHVSFHYEPGQPVLHDVRLEIRFGERIAIVGPNGCGKSTLINLIPRFYDPVAGAVCLDGLDLRAIRLPNIRRRIGLVTQQTHLFDDTVLNNIRYGSPSAREADAVAAAKKAHAHRFITEKLAEGYDTRVGQGGNRLSGGQRQRIALARAILRDPEILILDEATSQIDIESEQLIHQALEEFTRDRTAIMITHRLSTLTLADRIIVMEAGRIIDVGMHEELLRRCPLYARLHDIHFKRSA